MYTATSDTTVTAVTLDGSGDEADAADENNASEGTSDAKNASEETADVVDGENSDESSANTGNLEDAAEVLYCASAPDGSDIDDAVLYVEELAAPQYASDSSGDDSSDAETYQNFTYSISGGEASITGYVGEETEIVIPDTITVTGDSGTETFTVTSIAAKAFYQNTALTKVTISDNVLTIGDSAFYQCTALETVILSENLTTIGSYVFSGCSALAEIDLTSKINSVGREAFAYCTSLTSICIPKEMNEGAVTYTYNTTIRSAYGIFEGCTGLETATFEEGTTCVHAGLFAASGVQKVVLPDTVTSINIYAFTNCTALTEMAIPDTVTSIGGSAFDGCSGLTEISLPTNLESIGVRAFRACTALTEITLPDSLTSLGNYAFYGCTALTEVTVPAGCDCGRSGCLCGCGCDVCPGGDEDPLEGWVDEPMFLVTADNTVVPVLDPSGYVYEAVLSNRLEGVTTTIYQKETLYDMYDEPYEQITLWDAAEYGQENPLTTNSEGEYAWDVPEGLWSVVYEKEGYVTEQSDWMEVPPPQTDVNVGLVSYEAPVLEKVLAYTGSVEITFSKYMQTETLTAENITVKVNGTAVEGTFEMTNEEENPVDESETFTSVVTFIPNQAIVEGATVTVEVSEAAASYAGTAFAGEAVSAEAVLQPESITAEDTASVVSGESIEVTIQALPAEAVAGITVTVANQTSLLFTVEETEVTLDAEGKAIVHVTGSIAGESVIIFTLGDTSLTAETVVSVSMAAPSITRSEVAAGNIDASLITALAGNRDAEQISFVGSYDLSGGLTLSAKSGVTGDKALLLQEDDSTDSGLVLIDFCMIDSDGNITFSVEDAVDSVIVYGTNGDVTGDGEVNASDTLAILRGVSGRTTLDAVEEGFADVNLDEVVNSNDLLAVVKYVSGRTSSLN